ncbi:MAG: hypothetical protein ACKVT1_03795 [Dehalococcoidia bacterium]
MLKTYVTLDNEVLDLSALTEEEAGHLDRGWNAFLARAGYWEVQKITKPAGGFVSRSHFESPLGQALQDIEYRAGIRSGTLGAEPGDDIDADPFRDEAVSVPEAAAAKGVTVRAVHKAIERGDLIAFGRPAQVSRRSLESWAVSRGRQRAGRAASSRGAPATPAKVSA